jgi:hypothetical protein
MMARPIPLVAEAMEAQVALRDLRRSRAPLFEAAFRSGNHAAMQEAQALAETLRIAEAQARRIAGLAEPRVCPDGIFEIGHGRAA